LLKCEQYNHVIELATKGQRDFPASVKRGLMQVVVQAAVAVHNKVMEGYYWSQTVIYVEQRCTELISSNNFTSSYHQDEIRVQVIDILDSLIGNLYIAKYLSQFYRLAIHVYLMFYLIFEMTRTGILQGAQKPISEIVHRLTYPMLVKLPELLVLYHNYRDIVQLILEVLSVYTKDIILHLSEASRTVHQVTNSCRFSDNFNYSIISGLLFEYL